MGKKAIGWDNRPWDHSSDPAKSLPLIASQWCTSGFVRLHIHKTIINIDYTHAGLINIIFHSSDFCYTTLKADK